MDYNGFCVIDDLMRFYGHQSDCRAKVSDSEILTIAVCAAKFCQNHHERTLLLMQLLHYLSGNITPSRFNRRLHQLADWLPFLLEILMQRQCKGDSITVLLIPPPFVVSLPHLIHNLAFF